MASTSPCFTMPFSSYMTKILDELTTEKSRWLDAVILEFNDQNGLFFVCFCEFPHSYFFQVR